jgi:hypothetical protein
MKIGEVLLAVAVTGSMAVQVAAQEVPSGTYGVEKSYRESRALAHALAPTRIPVNFAGCGLAKIDGVLSPGEWSGAASQVINVTTAAGSVPATLYIMNDNLNLYVALKFPDSAPHEGSLGVEFDNDNDGVPFEVGDDGIVYNVQFGFFDDYRTATSFPEDTTGGGTTNGQGAFANDGTYSTYEIAHRFNTGDTGHDIALVPMLTVGFFINLVTIDSGTLYDSFYPGVANYDHITIQACQPPTLSGCGTPVVDGLVGASEWASAGKFRLSVALPHGNATTGTLYVMNDSFNLYTALAFDQAAALTGGNGLSLEFDTNNDGIISPGDDAIVFNSLIGFFDDFRYACGMVACSAIDTDAGGTNDGAGGFANNGSQSAFELSHPLNSGDAGHDFALAYGDTVGYRFSAILFEPAGSYGQTDFPWLPFANLTICSPGPVSSIRDLSKQVDILLGAGTLSSKNADALQQDLLKASGNLQRGKNRQAANDLSNFISDVTRMMRKGELARRYGQPLIDAANNAISHLS